MEVFERYSEIYSREQHESMSLQDYLLACRDDATLYASAAERMVAAIGEPEIIDTSRDPRLGRIFLNRSIKRYPNFGDFFGMEETVERIVGYFTYAAQGLEEARQILYLLGPVGGGKSSLAERLKTLMEINPIYVLKAGDEISPIFESPLSLFDPKRMGELLEEKYGIEQRRLKGLMSPWLVKRLDEFGGDISNFNVVKLMPSKIRQIAIAKTEPGDENNQDISTLVGKVDIRKLEHYSQNDPDAYSYSGGLNRTNQGMLEFVEMFKAPIKVLHPLLTATQESNYIGTETMGALPFDGMVLAHSNEAEWQNFKGNKNNEAFLDRICVVKVPYCLRVSEETRIYEKLLTESELSSASCAPETLELMSRFGVLTRLSEHENSNLYSKMRVYDGENLKDTDPKAKSIQEYREAAGVDEGMTGISTRFAFKVLSETFNHDTEEVSADPVHLMYVLEQAIKREQFAEEVEKKYLEFIKGELAPRFAENLGNEIQKAYLESYGEYGQNLFDRYISYADAWIEDQDFKDPDTGQMLDREILDTELSKIEKPAGIANPKDFRNEVVKFCLRARAGNDGRNPSWTSYEKLRDVIEKRMFSQVEDLLPVISFGTKKDSDTDKKHAEFLSRMCERGYTERQVRRLVEWYMRVNKAGYRERVLPGNKEYSVGDKIQKPQGGGGGEGGKEATDSGDGEDEFEFALTRDEFLDLFFEDLELPDLVKTSLKEVVSYKPERAGLTTAGTASNLNLVRTMRNSFARRLALKRPSNDAVEELEKRLFALEAKASPEPEDHEEMKAVRAELAELNRRRVVVPYIDPNDLRYNNFTSKPSPNTQAVMFCLMDVSGSMAQYEKDLAKRFFMLLHLFLERRYGKIDIVFIRHTHEAKEVDEETFLYSRETGGTIVSTALVEMREILKERYPPDEWNIYAAQASDGDNWSGDSAKCVDILQNELMPACQYYAYVEILDQREMDAFANEDNGAELWRSYRGVTSNWPNFVTKRIAKPGDIYPVFRELFAKNATASTKSKETA